VLLAIASAQETTDWMVTDGDTSPVTTPTPSTSPSTPTPPVQTTQGQSGDPLSRTDKIIIGVTCGVVGAAAIGGITVALINKKKAKLALQAEDTKRLEENA